MEEVAEVLKTEKLMTTFNLSHVKTMLKDLKGEESKKRVPKEVILELEQPSKRSKPRAHREEEEQTQEEEEEEEEAVEMDPIPKPKLIIKDPSPIRQPSP